MPVGTNPARLNAFRDLKLFTSTTAVNLLSLYEKYRKFSDKESDVYFGGRLGEYKYYDMDVVIGNALIFVKEMLL